MESTLWWSFLGPVFVRPLLFSFSLDLFASCSKMSAVIRPECPFPDLETEPLARAVVAVGKKKPACSQKVLRFVLLECSDTALLSMSAKQSLQTVWLYVNLSVCVSI